MRRRMQRKNGSPLVVGSKLTASGLQAWSVAWKRAEAHSLGREIPVRLGVQGLLGARGLQCSVKATSLEPW